jgi:hypothetical protein
MRLSGSGKIRQKQNAGILRCAQDDKQKLATEGVLLEMDAGDPQNG